MSSISVWNVIVAIINSEAFPAKINSFVLLLLNLLFARVFATLNPVCDPSITSFTTWAFAARYLDLLWPMPTRLITWRIYADFAQVLVNIARPMYVEEPLGFDLNNTVYALDSTTIDLCLSVFPWARFRAHKAAIKMHTLLDIRGPIPTFIEVSDGKMSDVKILDALTPEPGSFYLMDRAYVDFKRLHAFHNAGAFFVTRTKKGILLNRRYSHPVDITTGLVSDHTVVLASKGSRKNYPEALRRVHFHDVEQHRYLKFLTNNFDLPALTICHLYKSRWQVELFFKWIKQHLRIKAFYGYSENAVKTQIWIAVAVYVLVAIIKKRLTLEGSLHEILQVASLTLFEKSAAFTGLRRLHLPRTI